MRVANTLALICLGTLGSAAARLVLEGFIPEKYPIPASVNDSLPSDFLFGYASAAPQVEGASNADGKADNIWVLTTHTGCICTKAG
jgi:Glycosyl hydrolase family 1